MSEPERRDMRPKAEAEAVGAGALEVVALLASGAGAAKAVVARRAREEMRVVFIVMFVW